MFGGNVARNKIQRLCDSLFNLGTRSVLPLIANTHGGQTETCRGDAGEVAVASPVRRGTVKHHPGFRIGLIPEILERRPLNVVKQSGIAGLEVSGSGEQIGGGNLSN